MNCGFCTKEVPAARAFIDVARGSGLGDCICYECVTELYSILRGMEMATLRPLGNPVHPLVPRAPAIRLHPRKDH